MLEGWGYDSVWLSIAVSALIAGLLGIFVPDTRPPGTAEGASSQPLIHPSALKPGTILASHIWALATFSSFVPLYALQLGMDGSASVFVMNSAIILAIRSFGARLPDVLGPRRAATAALVSTMIGLGCMGLVGNRVGLFLGAAIFSIGHGLAFPALMTLAIRGAAPSERGSVVGTFTAFFDGSFGIGAISAGVIADLVGYRGAFTGAGVVALLGLGALFKWTRDGREGRITPEAAASR